MASVPAQAQKDFQKLVEEFGATSKELSKLIQLKQTLDGQLHENNMVKNEFNILEGDANVYKLIGPVLVKQDLEEAKSTVDKRIDYIQGEIKRIDMNVGALEEKQKSCQEKITKLQQKIQQTQTPSPGTPQSVK